MSDPRPYRPTDWEEDQKQAATDAVDSASAAVIHADASMEDLIEASRDIAANSKAVEKLTRESLIADNKKFRRRNTVLIIGIGLLLLSQLVQQARYYLDTKPQNDKQTEVLEALQNNQSDLNELVAFVESIKDDPTPQAATREELQVVFEAVFDTKALVECVVAAPDAAAVRVCSENS